MGLEDKLPFGDDARLTTVCTRAANSPVMFQWLSEDLTNKLAHLLTQDSYFKQNGI